METNKHNRQWSESKIKDYVSGDLSAAESFEMEQAMLDDPFLSDAVEGYKLAEGDLNVENVLDNLKGGDTCGLGALNKWLGIGGVAVVAAFLLWTFYQKEQVRELSVEVHDSMKENMYLEEAYEDSLAYMEIKLARIIPAQEEIRPEITRKEQIHIQEQQELLITERISAPDPLTPLGVDTGPEIRKKEIERPVPEVFFLYDFKLADHRGDYGAELFLKGDFLEGTSAVFERESKGVKQVADIVQVDYTGIMNDAMKAYANRDYRTALWILNRVEKKHLNDANAAFYGGLCYYNLAKWKQAAIHFRRAERHPSRVFDQEAQWYLALSLIKMEKMAASEAVLKEIVEKKGFYAEKARALLGH